MQLRKRGSSPRRILYDNCAEFLKIEYMAELRRNFFVGALFSGFFGALVCIFIYGAILPTTETGWLLLDGWDTFQHHIGWEFFRYAPWTWPIGINQFYGYPVGIPIIYTDSIPLVAIPLKLFAPWLPKTFQFQGLWILACLILQGVFGYILVHDRTKRVIESMIASVFFALSPILLFRVVGHAALAAHWVILWCLWLLVRDVDKLLLWHWLVALVIALLIQPYLFFMCLPLFLAYLAKKYFIERNIGRHRLAVFLCIFAASIFLAAYSIGLFYIGSASGPGFGRFSMNLNALVNPYGWSAILPDLSLAKEQYEGFAYVGVGGILLFVLALVLWLKGKGYLALKPLFPIITACLVLTALAVSNVIVAGGTELVAISLPQRLASFFGVIRSSGRMFWPVYYLLLLFALTFAIRLKRPLSLVVVSLALFIQVYDLHAVFLSIRARFSEMANTPVIELAGPFWDTVKKEYRHISYVPDYAYTIDFPSNSYGRLALFAAQNGLTLNTGYFARTIYGDNRHTGLQAEALLLGEPNTDTLYIITRDIERYTKNIDVNIHLVTSTDGFDVIAPNKNSLY